MNHRSSVALGVAGAVLFFDLLGNDRFHIEPNLPEQEAQLTRAVPVWTNTHSGTAPTMTVTRNGQFV